MDAFALLKNDHAKVATLFDQIEAASDATTRQQLFTQLKQELDVHAHIEETILYPALKAAPETQDITEEAYEEHQEVKDLLSELEATPADDEEWNDMIMELRENVEHHVEEEEGEMFTKARSVLNEQQLNQIGAQLAAEKQQQQQKAAAAS
ncbi:MAG TPA: hemerythrin domain-containing protein [Pyrinomonadaceae bacterium]|nr:hemerythrin domain-containing protein [Pyrinomonadaceae bacterium]